MRTMQVTRHPSAESFLNAARSLLMAAEAENNLILGVAEGLARGIASTPPSDLQERPGLGVVAMVDGRPAVLGRRALLDARTTKRACVSQK